MGRHIIEYQGRPAGEQGRGGQQRDLGGGVEAHAEHHPTGYICQAW